MLHERAREAANPSGGWQAFCAAARDLSAEPQAAQSGTEAPNQHEGDDVRSRR